MEKFVKRMGMSLVEVIVATSVFLIAAVGLLYSYLKCMELEELGRNSQLAISATESALEEIKNSTFSTLYQTYNNTTFAAPSGVTGIGVIYVNNSNLSLLQIKAVFCWRQSNGRVIGEDKNLNGVLDAGEDLNNNGQIDGYVQMQTKIFG